MPIYHYRCSACDHQQEILAKISDPAPERCASCNAQGTLTKQIARSSFQLKGSGWYKQGYEGASNQGASTSSAGSSASGGGE